MNANQIQYAGLWIRFIAFCVDCLFITIIGGLTGGIVGFIVGARVLFFKLF